MAQTSISAVRNSSRSRFQNAIAIASAIIKDCRLQLTDFLGSFKGRNFKD